MNIQHRFVTLHGIRTHYLIAGEDAAPEAPVVVLLHGGGLDSAEISWSPFLTALDSGARVFALDWPGFGESDRPEMPYSADFYAHFVGAFLDRLGVSRASLVGVSMGGAAALGFALLEPASVHRLVLVDSYGLQRELPFARLSYAFVRMPGVSRLTWASLRSRWMVRYTLGWLLKRPGAVTAELVEQIYREIMRPDASLAWTAYQKSEVTPNGPLTCYLDRLAEISAPTLVVHGSQDALVPPDCAREAAARLPNACLSWMEGCGHWPQRDNPAEFNRLAAGFLGLALSQPA